MGNVFLYLLGAGASCQFLPLASEFKDRLPKFAIALREAGPRGPQLRSDDPIWGANRNNLLNTINWLAEEASHHFSVDTFAKKLFFLKDIKNLNKLKAALSAYLIIEQSRNHVDQRYDAFFASILEFDNNSNLVTLPEHLRIFTWNYDTQLEKAYYGFCKDIKKVYTDVTFNNRTYKINGQCGTNQPGHLGDAFRAALDPKRKPAWEEGIKLYNESFSSESEISFAWEDRTNTLLKNKGLSLLTDVSDIVIIGYSFPYFNREIDDLIFKHFFHLRRVYLQYPEGVHASIEERLKSMLPPDVAIIRKISTPTTLFYIPDNF